MTYQHTNRYSPLNSLTKKTFHRTFQHNLMISGNHRVCEYLTDSLADRMFLFKRATIPDSEDTRSSMTENELGYDQLSANS